MWYDMNNNNQNSDRNTFYNLWTQIKNSIEIKNGETEIQLPEDKMIIDDLSGEYYMKIILAGDGAVGKTSLRKRYIGEGFSTNYQQTIGADFAIYKEQIGSFSVRFIIWDLAGQFHFHQVRAQFYRGTHGALIVCDITNPSSFENIKHWINELWKNNDLGPVPFIIVGNKCDLRQAGIPSIEDERVHRIAKIINSETLKEHGFGIKSIITSAKTGAGVREAFKRLAIQVIAHQKWKEKQNGQ